MSHICKSHSFKLLGSKLKIKAPDMPESIIWENQDVHWCEIAVRILILLILDYTIILIVVAFGYVQNRRSDPSKLTEFTRLRVQAVNYGVFWVGRKVVMSLASFGRSSSYEKQDLYTIVVLIIFVVIQFLLKEFVRKDDFTNSTMFLSLTIFPFLEFLGWVALNLLKRGRD